MASSNDKSRSRPSSGGRSGSGGGKPRGTGGGKPRGSGGGRPGSGKPGGGRSDSRGGRDSRGGQDGRGGPGRNDSRGDSRGGSQRDEVERTGKKTAGPKTWGGVARRGAAKVGEAPLESEDQSFSPEEVRKYEQRVAKRAAEEQRREGLREEAREAVSRADMPKKRAKRSPKEIERRPLPGRAPMPVDTKVSFARALGERDGQKANRKLGQAAAAFEAGRYDDARKLLKPLADQAPEIPEVQELYGLSLYRLGRWAQAADRLEEFRALAGTPEQNPVLADCYRALQRWTDADFFWAELREYSPSGELMTEGRIVAAGVLSDQGRVDDAVRLLEQKWSRPKRPKEHHFSRAYALADLYERAGDEPRSRELFGWIASHDADFADSEARSK